MAFNGNAYNETIDKLKESPEALIQKIGSLGGIAYVDTLARIKDGSLFGAEEFNDSDVIKDTWRNESDKILQNVLANFEHLVSPSDGSFNTLKRIFETDGQHKKLDEAFGQHFQREVAPPSLPVDRWREEQKVEAPPSPRVGRMFESPPPSPRGDQPTNPPGGIKNIK